MALPPCCPLCSGAFDRQFVVAPRVYGDDGRRAVFGPYEKFQTDPNWNAYPMFHEYFHADEGRGCGASHQTGWTGLIAKLLQQTGEYRELDS